MNNFKLRLHMYEDECEILASHIDILFNSSVLHVTLAEVEYMFPI